MESVITVHLDAVEFDYYVRLTYLLPRCWNSWSGWRKV